VSDIRVPGCTNHSLGYRVVFADGRPSLTTITYVAARDQARRAGAETVGHSYDLDDGGPFTLFWASHLDVDGAQSTAMGKIITCTIARDDNGRIIP
jgi:hypothetical protein